MNQIPAVCERCGRVLGGLVAFGPNARGTVTMKDCMVVCPCGGVSNIPDGVYRQSANGIIEVIATSGKSAKQLELFASLLNKARQNNASADEVKALVKNEFPELASFSDYFPKTRTELYAFLAILVSLILALSQQMCKSEASVININNTINNYSAPPTNKANAATEPPSRKFNRNAKCPLCSSGKKYRQCCGVRKKSMHLKR